MIIRKYGQVLVSGYLISDSIQDNVLELESLIYELSRHGLRLVSFNKEGILFEEKEVYLGLTSLQKDVENIKRNLSHVVAEVDQLKITTDNINFSDNKYKDTEFTGMYLLYDGLPEHIKKELKIYIKK